MNTKKNRPTRRRADATRAAKAQGDGIRGWLHDLRIAASKRLAETRKADDETRRKPEPRREPEYLIAHPYGRARIRHGRRRGHAGNVAYLNPDRDAKSLASGRLRKELRP